MSILLSDLRFALRQLRKSPGLSLLAVLILALGIGANAAIFTVIESVLLRPLPYADANRLVYIGPPSDKPSFGSTSWLNYHDIHEQSKLLEGSAGYSEDIGIVEAPEGSQSVVAPRVSTGIFTLLGGRPLMGRTFTDAEGETNGPPTVLLSEGIWRQSFHANPAIVGQVVNISGKPHTIVGVMPKSFHFPDSAGPDLQRGIWLPLQPTAEMLKERGYSFFNIVGKLRPDASMEQFQQELNSIAAHIPRENDHEAFAFHAIPYQQVLTGPVRPVLFALFAALGLVLLIACANVSNLLIARCLGRRQEFAVRSALGAGRARLFRQVLCEGLTLSLLGCGVGVAFAELAMMAVKKLPDGTIPNADAIAIHWTVVLVLAAIAVLTTAISSVLPAVLVSRSNPQSALQAASRGIGARSVSGKLTAWLTAGEIALSTVLLVGTGLLFRTLWNLEQSHMGFNAEHLTTFSAMPADATGFSGLAVSEDTEHAKSSVATLIYQPVLDQIRHLPGIETAALATSPPLSGMDMRSSFDVVGQPHQHPNTNRARVSAVSGEYARAMGTPLARGRMIEDSDVLSTPFVTVVNEAFVKQYFPSQNPLGKQINLGGKDTGMIKPYTIVGVLADQVDRGVGAAVQPLLLLPQQQIPTTSLFYPAMLGTMVNFVVRTRGDVPVAAEVRSVFRRDAPGFALDGFQTMQEAVEKNTFNQRLGLYLVAGFAGLAVMMVIAGLYGILSQLVSYRRHEIGVRMALGATRQSVAGLVLRQGGVLVAAGLCAGLALSAASGRMVASFLYEVRPVDAWTYVAVVFTLSAIGMTAALLPARRAASIEPMQALRED
jgi:putative ABC transport system permease protein